MFSNLKQHHVGCLVFSIEEFKNENRHIWADQDYSEVYDIKMQDVKVCFITGSSETLIELVEPGSGNKALKKLLDKGVSYYHIAFMTHHYDEAVKKFTDARCHQLSEFLSEAFSGKRCSFFYHPQLKLIELIEST